MPHFSTAEFDARLAATRAEMDRRGLDAMLLFAPEAQYWATGYDTFGFCFFQCLIIDKGAPVLLTRSADLRQAQYTSTIKDIRIWKDQQGADPTEDLAQIIAERGLTGKRLGVEFNTQGLTAHYGRLLEARLKTETLVDASDLMPRLRLIKSPAEIAYSRKAGEIGDAAYLKALEVAGPGVDESHVLQALQGEVFAQGGDYAGNEFIIGSGDGALLCRYYSGRRVMDAEDQLTLEWAGAWRRYHSAYMRTIPIGKARPEHHSMFAAAHDALHACEEALKPGRAMAEVFDAHAQTMDKAGLGHARLNACGYALGASYNPCWMEPFMFYEGAETEMAAGMIFFLHMILMDSETGAAMTLGRTSLITETGTEQLTNLPLTMDIAE